MESKTPAGRADSLATDVALEGRGAGTPPPHDRVEQGLVAVHHHSDEVASPLVQRMDATNAHLAQCIDTGDARPTQ